MTTNSISADAPRNIYTFGNNEPLPVAARVTIDIIKTPTGFVSELWKGNTHQWSSNRQTSAYKAMQAALKIAPNMTLDIQ